MANGTTQFIQATASCKGIPLRRLTGEETLSNLYYLQFQDANLFGYYGFLQGSAATPNAWLYHFDLGYEYVTPGTASGTLYLFDLASGHWWFSASSLFP